jgi:glycerol-3-phosphate dehydrogenase
VAERGAEPIAPGALEVAGELDWAVTVECAATLEDVIYRRTRTALYDVGEREALLEPAAARLATLLGWDDARRAREVAAVRERLAADLDFREASG